MIYTLFGSTCFTRCTVTSTPSALGHSHPSQYDLIIVKYLEIDCPGIHSVIFYSFKYLKSIWDFHCCILDITVHCKIIKYCVIHLSWGSFPPILSSLFLILVNYFKNWFNWSYNSTMYFAAHVKMHFTTTFLIVQISLKLLWSSFHKKYFCLCQDELFYALIYFQNYKNYDTKIIILSHLCIPRGISLLLKY